MRDELIALAKLAKMDIAAKDFEEELRSVPARIEQMRADVQTLETLLAQERAQIDDAEALRQQRVSEISDRNEALSRAKSKGSRARTLRESDAAEREVEANRRAINDIKEDIAKLDATIEAKSASFAERETQFEEARTSFADEEKQAKERLIAVEAERSKVMVGRDDLLARLPKRIVKRYEKLRTRPKYASVAIVSTTTCISCQMALPPQLFINLQRGEDFHSCPRCHAWLVHASFAEEA